ncbi:MAG: SIMPL domain-containing protein [Halioglobus sp.]
MRNTFTLRKATRLLLMVGLLSMGQVALAEHGPSPRVVVTGEGNANIAPDMAILNLSVMREAATAREALTANTAAMQKVLDAMSKLGIAKRDLQTSNFDIQPRYVYPQRQNAGTSEPPQLVGYTVRNALSVRVRDINRVGEVLDTSVTLGVNEGGSINFTNDDPAAVITQARISAVKDAMSKASTLAEAAGVKLGEVLEIFEQNYTPQPMVLSRMKMEMASADAAVPIAAGENTYRVTVNLSLAIAQ